MNNLKTLISLALKEDIGSGDITSKAIIPKKKKATAAVVAKENLVVAGIKIAAMVFKKVDKKIKAEIKIKDGGIARKGAVIMRLAGPARSLLIAERTALNFLQHLSGIANLTRKFVQKIPKGGPLILDTRKTTPGWRKLEKYAVRMGGGKNHRHGLYDMFLIKGNHIDIAGSVTEAIYRVRSKKGLLIECEVRNLKELKEAIVAGADIIMLDNFSPKMVQKSFKNAKKHPKLEISGGISLKNIKKYAKIGVDYISIGALTHSPPAVDIHMTIKI